MTTETTTTIRERAQWHRNNFERGERESELPTRGKIWVLKDRKAVTSGDSRNDHPTTELVRQAHIDPDGDQMLPDDWRYEYIVDALHLIIETAAYNGDVYEDAWIDVQHEIEGDVYNSNLMAWASSHAYRVAYADQQVVDLGIAGEDGIYSRLMHGNAYEKQFVFQSVLEFIQNEIS